MTVSFRQKLWTVAGATAVGFLFAACAGVPLRTEPTTSGISAAEEAGAADVPRAALHLLLAKEQLASAKGLAEKGKRPQAASMLLRAEADAELAIALSREDAEREAARAAVLEVRQLRIDNHLTVDDDDASTSTGGPQ